MKHTKNTQSICMYRHYRKPYPNAAEPGYFMDKLVDGFLSLATCMGSITVFFLLVIL